MIIVGEYYHIDHKEKRQKELQKEQENHETKLDHRIYQEYSDWTINRFSSQSSIDNKYQMALRNDLTYLDNLVLLIFEFHSVLTENLIKMIST